MLRSFAVSRIPLCNRRLINHQASRNQRPTKNYQLPLSSCSSCQLIDVPIAGQVLRRVKDDRGSATRALSSLAVVTPERSPSMILLKNKQQLFSTSSQNNFFNECDDEIVVSILGPANAGKSTLFNRLMCKESNRVYKLSSEKKPRRPKRSKGRIGHKVKPSNSPKDGGAIVSATPGTTRDRRECIGRIGGTRFTLVDTAGVDGERISLLSSGKSNKDPMLVNMMVQTLEAAKKSDLILVMFDAKVGVTTDLEEIVRWLRKLDATGISTDEYGELNEVDKNDSASSTSKKVVILGNKLEGDSWANHHSNQSRVMENLIDVSRYGFGDAIPISAEHGEGMADIAVIIEQLNKEKRRMLGKEEVNEYVTSKENNDSGQKIEKPLQLTILGRQNVGKSTLVNALLKQNRVISGERPGLTRDSIAVNWLWNDERPVQLIDTAGIRRIAKRDHSDDIEDLAVRDAIRSMKLADVAVLVLDARARMLQRQELAILGSVLREGRSLVIAANKMDLLVDEEYSKEQYADDVRKQLEIRFPMLRRTPIVAMSSLYGDSVEDLMPVVFNARDRWSQMVATPLLNRWLADVIEIHPPPMQNGRPVRIKYIIQSKGRPPTFLLFCNTDKLPMSYMRFLNRNFQDTFSMYGMEVRMAVKKSKENPYENNKVKKNFSMGIGGAHGRKRRTVNQLKTIGKKLKKGKSRSFRRQ